MSNLHVFEKLKKAEKGIILSIIAYLLLSSIKLFAGYFFYSSALVADGINNATDVISSIFILIGLRIARKPSDDDHLYGHFRAELISSLIASFIMLYAGLQVVISSVKNLFFEEIHELNQSSIFVAGASTIFMLIIFFYNFNLSKKLKSSALKAAAFDNLSDAIVSLGTVIGIITARFGFNYADSITAIIVGFVIIYAAIKIFREATHILTDGIEKETIDEVREIVKNIDGVLLVKDIKGRNHGLMNFIDVTVAVDANLNVRDSHEITVHIEEALKNKFFACETLVHIEPAENKNKISN